MASEYSTPYKYYKNLKNHTVYRSIMKRIQDESVNDTGNWLVPVTEQSVKYQVEDRLWCFLSPYEIQNKAEMLQALAIWNRYRQVFEFDPEMEKMLTEMDFPDSMPVDVLKNVPYPSFYVQSAFLEEMIGIDGFVVCFDSDSKGNNLKIRLEFLDENTGFSIPIRLVPGKSLKDSMDCDVRPIPLGIQTDEFGDTLELAEYCLKLVLYLCSDNKDVIPAVEPKRTENPNETVLQKVKPSTVNTWKVGAQMIRIFKKFRGSAVKASQQEAESHSKRRPHLRKAHWHHYWTGSKQDPQGRRLVLKWIQPVFINDDSSSDIGEQINSVHKES